MLEIVTKLFDLVLKGGKAMQDNAKLERRREFGQALLTCYLRLLEVTRTGEKIISELERFADRSARYRAEGRSDLSHGTFDLQALCNEQGLNLIRLSSAISDVSHEMSVFAPDISDQLIKLVSGKRHAVWKLANTLGTGYVYLGGEPEQPPKFGPVTRPPSDDMQKMRDSSVFLMDEWSTDQSLVISEYLTTSSPQERLDHLGAVANQLRELIVDFFSVDDILWSIGTFRERRPIHFSEDTERAKVFFKQPDP